MFPGLPNNNHRKWLVKLYLWVNLVFKVKSDLEERFIRSLQKVNFTNNNEDEDVSVEEEFAAYIKENSSNEEDPQVSQTLVGNKAEDEVFEDVSEEAVRNEE